MALRKRESAPWDIAFITYLLLFSTWWIRSTYIRPSKVWLGYRFSFFVTSGALVRSGGNSTIFLMPTFRHGQIFIM